MSTQFTNRQWRLPNNENKDKQSNYSMDFDGTNDYITVSNSTAYSSYSVSCWINADTLTNFTRLVSLDSVNHRFLGLHGDGTLISGYNSGGWSEFFTTSTITTGTWNHIVLVDNGTNTKIYVNTVENTLSNSIAVDGPTYYIGTYNGSANYFDGKIDAVSIFDYALSSSQVTTLYGSSSTGIGNPMSLSPKPVAFYQLGDKSAFNGANYLVPNIAAQEDDGDIAVSYSPYALDFDGVDDYITVPNSTDFDFSTGNFSWSLWLNYETHVSYSGLLYTGSSNSEYRLKFHTSGQILFLQNADGDSQVADLGTNIAGTGWHHLCLVRSSGTITTYLDGSAVDTDTRAGNVNSNGNDLLIGKNGSKEFNGKISNLSIWNAALTSSQVTEIYSEGIPQNLNNHSAVSSLVSWWQLGSNSSFNTNWTVLDEKGTNNGTSVNMTEDAIVDGVGSSANGLSSGMGGDEVIGDAPYSTANSLSVNMDVLDRVTDTPS